jgi:HSP20 family molecular chaperone IbpA
MNRTIFLSMAAGLAICLLLTAWLALSNWQLQQQLSALSSNSQDNATQTEADWLQRLGQQQVSIAQPAIPSWDPFDELDRMQQQMDRWIQGNLPGATPRARTSFFGISAAQPDIRIEEDSSAIRVRISVPEGSEIELNTAIEEQHLRISGVVTTTTDSSADGFSRSFQSSSQFSRQFPLPSAVDTLGMIKETEDNLIIITLPKV